MEKALAFDLVREQGSIWDLISEGVGGTSSSSLRGVAVLRADIIQKDGKGLWWERVARGGLRVTKADTVTSFFAAQDRGESVSMMLVSWNDR
jgi:hypothetical protein